MQMQTKKYPEWLNEEERKTFDEIRGIAKQFDAESLMIYPNAKTVYIITPEEIPVEKILPMIDRYALGNPLALGYIELPHLSYEEKEEGRFYHVEPGENIQA